MARQRQTFSQELSELLRLQTPLLPLPHSDSLVEWRALC